MPCACCTFEGRFDTQYVSLQGTVSSKKKKMAKLKRVMAQVKKQDRREKRNTDQNFAAIQLLHDPQVRFACAWPRSLTLITSCGQQHTGQSDESIHIC